MQSYYNYDEIRNHSTKNKQRSNIDITKECFSNLGLSHTLTYDL